MFARRRVVGPAAMPLNEVQNTLAEVAATPLNTKTPRRGAAGFQHGLVDPSASTAKFSVPKLRIPVRKDENSDETSASAALGQSPGRKSRDAATPAFARRPATNSSRKTEPPHVESSDKPLAKSRKAPVASAPKAASQKAAGSTAHHPASSTRASKESQAQKCARLSRGEPVSGSMSTQKTTKESTELEQGAVKATPAG